MTPLQELHRTEREMRTILCRINEEVLEQARVDERTNRDRDSMTPPGKGEGDRVKAPFPWFGGKSKCAHIVWNYFADVDNYVEPFAGSLAALLARPPGWNGVETVNDADHYIVNFWRALKNDPVGVAQYANNPVNEADLTSRHLWLVNTGKERIAHLEGDPDYYDSKVAGWWVWGICCWIGSGFCSGTGPWISDDSGQLVHLGNAGHGVNRKRVHLGNAGHGVNRGNQPIGSYFAALAERLRYVRVCCGDWQRVVTGGALNMGNVKGVFLDPPYDQELRDKGCYNVDSDGLSAEVFEWAIEHGDRPDYRVILCGYEGEHDMPDTWKEIEWTANRAYGRMNSVTDNSVNRKKERLWISPQCRHRKQVIHMGLDAFGMVTE
jgi:DNA adenine methylase